MVLRWILLLLAMAAFGMAFRTDSPGLLAALLLAGFVALLGAFFGFVNARVQGVAQGQASREIELLVTSRTRRAGRGDDGSGAILAAGVGAMQRDPEPGPGDNDGSDGGGSSDGGGGDGGGDGGSGGD